MKDLMERLRDFVEERDWAQFHSPKNLAMALSVEVSEVIEHFQWLTQEQSYHIEPSKIEEIREEIGDVVIYLAMLSDKLGIDPIKAAFDKMEKNRKNYPAKLVKSKAKKYKEY